MKIKYIALTDLSINNANDRHGELADDGMAMEWLLTHRADHMRNLAMDIVKEGRIYESPLVHEEGGAFIVYDGNRRVTSLKLLDKPTHAPTDSWREFFQNLRSEWAGTFPTKIECQIETDRDRIDEILYRRHTGGQSGIGQSPWDPDAKSNFVKRTGKKDKVNVAEEIEDKLKEGGFIKKTAKVPRSNLNRLLSSEAFKNRVGISVRKNQMEITHNETKVIGALTRIAQDLISKTIVLDDVWSNKDKKEYLDLLETEGFLPGAADSLSTNKNFKTLKPTKSATSTQSSSQKTSAKPKKRKTLIRPDIDYGVLPQTHTKRAMDIWGELQHHLEFDKHGNAIAVLFRVLLEFSVENYISQKSIAAVHPNDSLGKKFHKVLDHMLGASSIDKKYHEGLKKFENTEPILSANTMNKFLHHKHFFPSDHHLKSMWDSLSEFIVVCLKA
jgi:hypothetical protein